MFHSWSIHFLELVLQNAVGGVLGSSLRGYLLNVKLYQDFAAYERLHVTDERNRVDADMVRVNVEEVHRDEEVAHREVGVHLDDGIVMESATLREMHADGEVQLLWIRALECGYQAILLENFSVVADVEVEVGVEVE